jgi:hypothetical protein
MYLVSVKCMNYAGGISYATAAVTVDSTPPVTKQSPGDHPDRPCDACTEVSASVDYAYGADNEDAGHPLAMVASWSGAFQDLQSSIAGYTASVQVRTLTGTAEDCGLPDCRVVPHEIDRLATSGVFPGSFPLGHLVCVIVEAANGAGSTSSAESCARVWDTAITPGLVFDGPTPGGDADYLPDLHVVHASWSSFNISNPADYLHFEWAVGTVPGGTDTMIFMPVVPHIGHYTDKQGRQMWRAIDTVANFTIGGLEPGVRYYVTVKATGSAALGSQTATSFSDGFVADDTAPVCHKRIITRIYIYIYI